MFDSLEILSRRYQLHSRVGCRACTHHTVGTRVCDRWSVQAQHPTYEYRLEAKTNRRRWTHVRNGASAQTDIGAGSEPKMRRSTRHQSICRENRAALNRTGRRPWRAILFGLFGVMLALGNSTSQAAFTIQFDPTQTTVQSNGSDQTFSIDLLITHDGTASPTTFSGFTIDMINPGAELVLDNGQELDFDFTNDARAKLSNNTGLYSFGGSSTAQQYDTTAGATRTLMTVDFNLDGSVTNRTFNLDLSLRNASRGLASNGSMTSIAPEVTVMSGFFTVNGAVAVPEPTSVLFFSLLATGAVISRRSKRKLPTQTP